MSPKSGRFRNADMTQPAVSAENFAALTSLHVQKRVVDTANAIKGRFTLDDFLKKYGEFTRSVHAGNTFAFAALGWLVACGVLEQDGMMHWRLK